LGARERHCCNGQGEGEDGEDRSDSQGSAFWWGTADGPTYQGGAGSLP
jgi:hypothetical protein